MSVWVTIGHYCIQTATVENQGGLCRWLEYHEIEDMRLPVNIDGVPDVIIYLVQGGGNSVSDPYFHYLNLSFFFFFLLFVGA